MNGYNWQNGWVKKYESLWSISHKFMAANSITNQDFYQLFSTYSKNKEEKKINTNLIYNEILSAFLSNMVNFNFNKQNEISIRSLVSEKKDISKIFDNNLKYCASCIKNGYHSVFHQYKISLFCSFHPTEQLVSRCPYCIRQTPFRIINENNQCFCYEEKFGFKNILSFTVWDNFNPQIKDEKFKEWLIDENCTKFRSYFNANQNVNLKSLKHMTFKFDSMISKKKNSSKTIMGEREYREDFTHFRSIFKSIARNKKKQLNKSQRKNFSFAKKKLTPFNDIQVEIYALWRMYLEGHEEISSVENGKPRGKYINEQDRYFSVKLYNSISEINFFLNKNMMISYSQRQYIINQCFCLLILNIYSQIKYKVADNRAYSIYEDYINPIKIGETNILDKQQAITFYYI